MKILIDAHKIGEKHEGTSTHLTGLYGAMMALRPNWEFVFVGPYLGPMQQAFGRGSNCRYIELTSANKWRRLLWDLPRIMRREQPDYTHFQYISPLWQPSPTLVTIHDLLFLEPQFKGYFPWTYRWINGLLFRLSAVRAKRLCAVSKYAQGQLSQRYGIAPDQITITPNAVKAQDMDLEEAKKRVAAYDLDRFILFVSRVEPRKNHKTLWRAFEQLGLNEKGYKLVFVGKREWIDPELDQIMDSADSKMHEAVLWLDEVPHEDLWAFYKAADLFVYPSLGEGFGIPPLEAASVGTKVVCAKNTAMVDFDFFPYLIPADRPEDLAQSLSDALMDQHYPSGQIAQIIQTKYHWEASALTLIKALSPDETK